jgi:hypothetical protein
MLVFRLLSLVLSVASVMISDTPDILNLRILSFELCFHRSTRPDSTNPNPIKALIFVIGCEVKERNYTRD